LAASFVGGHRMRTAQNDVDGRRVARTISHAIGTVPRRIGRAKMAMAGVPEHGQRLPVALLRECRLRIVRSGDTGHCIWPSLLERLPSGHLWPDRSASERSLSHGRSFWQRVSHRHRFCAVRHAGDHLQTKRPSRSSILEEMTSTQVFDAVRRQVEVRP